MSISNIYAGSAMCDACEKSTNPHIVCAGVKFDERCRIHYPHDEKYKAEDIPDEEKSRDKFVYIYCLDCARGVAPDSLIARAVLEML